MSTTQTQGRNRRIVEARRLFDRVLKGDLRARAEVLETLTTSDFPYLLGAAYSREMLGEYASVPAVWQRYSTRSTVPDFRPKSLIDLLGGRAGLTRVPEATEYKARKLSEAKYEFKVEKYGDRFPLTWEMLKNDDLDAFRNLPSRLAVAARETEDIVTAKTLFNSGGTALNTDFFKTANKNAPGTAALSTESLEAALTNISTRKDNEKRPIVVSGAVLMVPPTLEMQARRILNATEIRRTDGNTTTVESNYLTGLVELVVNPWLTVVNTGTNAATNWFVLPNPNQNNNRPALVTGFLRGEEDPDLRVKADAGNRVGGGAVAPEEGSFDDDTIQYRVRHVTGAGTVVPTATYASTGAS
ncbi:Mu-like prophage major head subunit gpT family protein [Ruania rhizosphaerae]|uniref:phage major capsid protein n=1 Tax=Ruania rhizosphaerae TaxID=1840413 RepID=UPI00135B28A2|nr:Mu-like prophage major head subunit gpT family protein [Ruania rhizosphaerae]